MSHKTIEHNSASSRGAKLMGDWYELIGQTPVRMDRDDVLGWAMAFERMDRRVAESRFFGIVRVSTIFLSLDHGFRGKPLLFETMEFWNGEHGGNMARCSTWLEAQEQHARMCAEAIRPGSVAAYVARYAVNWWNRAGCDLGRRWRELRGIEPSWLEREFDAFDAAMAQEW